jgi:hypothetical protein
MTDIVSAAIVGGVAGIITGSLSSLFAPWVQWGIEQKRLKFQRRKELVADWRAMIKTINYIPTEAINTNSTLGDMLMKHGWLTLKSHLSIEALREIESSWGKFAVNTQKGPEVRILTDEVARIEKDWKLV